VETQTRFSRTSRRSSGYPRGTGCRARGDRALPGGLTQEVGTDSWIACAPCGDPRPTTGRQHVWWCTRSFPLGIAATTRRSRNRGGGRPMYGVTDRGRDHVPVAGPAACGAYAPVRTRKRTAANVNKRGPSHTRHAASTRGPGGPDGRRPRPHHLTDEAARHPRRATWSPGGPISVTRGLRALVNKHSGMVVSRDAPDGDRTGTNGPPCWQSRAVRPADRSPPPPPHGPQIRPDRTAGRGRQAGL